MTEEPVFTSYAHCMLCPRQCGVNRLAGQTGFCGMDAALRIARAALHFWEEPCLSGAEGSGTVFFSGCNLRCVYCQNHDISTGKAGTAVSPDRLAEIFLELQAKGANNINLVTGAPFLPHIVYAINKSKKDGLVIPIVYNSSGYESLEALQRLDGLIDIYLPDLKYDNPDYAARYSAAPDYPKQVWAAVREMVRQCGTPRFDSRGIMQKGVIIRHLMLPGRMADTKEILRDLYEAFGDTIYISLMNQYTVLQEQMSAFPELCRTITAEEYEEAVSFAQSIGIQNGFLQEGGTAKESFIPAFDGEGVLPDKATQIP